MGIRASVSLIWWEKQQRGDKEQLQCGFHADSVCVHSQPTLGHFVNGHYAIGPIQHLTRDWGGSNLRKAMAPPPFVLIFTSAKQTSVPGETLCPHRQTGRKLCNKIPKTWMVSGQEKKKERKHVVHHITQTLSPQSGLQREYKIPPGEEKKSKCIQKSKMMQ